MSADFEFSADVEIQPIETIGKDWPVLLATARVMFPYLSEAELARVISLAVGICRDCHAAAAGCCCGRDE